ncbi:glycoside hydrolase family 25 protein [Rhizobium sp. RAF56]|jgi:GH25 family lysozyme M1 (1,4-beta-N-acetylmuramidase)|uniref:glycoside hydrolase family 25 protein n=1 Tax=Rhizobium sp. RAF56 TaxID=3233062 RepID=UPI003F9E3377
MKGYCRVRALTCFLLLTLALPGLAKRVSAGESPPWNNPENALIVDAYELNAVDWDEMLTDKRIAGFISKASDGLPESFSCTGDHAGDTYAHCKTMWRKYAVSRELFQTRRLVAKSKGLLWGAYHMARPGNPVDQANHFLDYAKPSPDELMVIDIDGLDTKQFMSLDDAQIFVGHIKTRTGRYPILYTNHTVAQYIADHRDNYKVLSRLPLWYARYRPEMVGTFPMGNWERYHLWQFSSGTNCSERDCPYRVPGTLDDIDVDIAMMTKAELAKVWPQGALVPAKPEPEPEPILIAKGGICTSPQSPSPINLSPILTASITPRAPAVIDELNYQNF